jgi:hypothetical protein
MTTNRMNFFGVIALHRHFPLLLTLILVVNFQLASLPLNFPLYYDLSYRDDKESNSSDQRRLSATAYGIQPFKRSEHTAVIGIEYCRQHK